MLENEGGGAAGGFGCATCLCTIKPKASICSGCQYVLLRGCGCRGYTSAGTGMQKGHEEVFASIQQGHNELISRHATTTPEDSNYAAFFKCLVVILPVQFLWLHCIVKANSFQMTHN